MTKPSTKDNWTEEQWSKRAKTIINRMRKPPFEFGQLVEEFHEHFNRHRNQYTEDWTVVCKQVLILSQPTCSLYETIWSTLGQVKFRDKLPLTLHALHKLAQTYRIEPEEVERLVEKGTIGVDTTDKQAEHYYNAAVGRLDKDTKALVVGDPQMRRDETWVEALMDRLYRADGLNIVDFTMSVVMTHPNTIKGVLAGITRFKGLEGTEQGLTEFAKALDQYYTVKGSSGGGRGVTRIIDHWEEEQRTKEEEKAKATDIGIGDAEGER